jgi:hypothetical protein
MIRYLFLLLILSFPLLKGDSETEVNVQGERGGDWRPIDTDRWAEFWLREKDRVDYKAYLEYQPALFDKLFPGYEKLQSVSVSDGLSERQKESILAHYFQAQEDEQDGNGDQVLPSLKPYQDGWKEGMNKLHMFIKRCQGERENQTLVIDEREKERKREKTTLVIYHIGPVDATQSSDVAKNNVVIFTHAVSLDDEPENDSLSPSMGSTFYWINIVQNHDESLANHLPSHSKRNIRREKRKEWRERARRVRENPLGRIVKDRLGLQSNVAITEWPIATSDIYLHLRTLTLLREALGEEVLLQTFGSVLILSHGVRGPTTPLSLSHSPSLSLNQTHRHWIDIMRDPLFEHKHSEEDKERERKAVGLVGITANCDTKNEQIPHLQSYALAFPVEIIPRLLDHFFGTTMTTVSTPVEGEKKGSPIGTVVVTKLTSYSDVVRHYEIGLSRFVFEVLDMELVALQSREIWRSERKTEKEWERERKEERERDSERESEREQGGTHNSQKSLISSYLRLWENEGPCMPFTDAHDDHYPSHNPQSWCSLSRHLDRVPLHKWGGGAFRYQGVLCPIVKVDMERWLVDYWKQNALFLSQDSSEKEEEREKERERRQWLRKNLIVPESFFADYDFRHDLNRDFYREIFHVEMEQAREKEREIEREREREKLIQNQSEKERDREKEKAKERDEGGSKDKVCYVIEVTKKHLYLDPVGDEEVLDQDAFPPIRTIVGSK